MFLLFYVVTSAPLNYSFLGWGGQFREWNTHSDAFNMLGGCFPCSPNETQPRKVSASCWFHPASGWPRLPFARKMNCAA